MDSIKRASLSVRNNAYRFNPRRYLPTQAGGYSRRQMRAYPAGGPLDLLGSYNPRTVLPVRLGGHNAAQMAEPHHSGLYTMAQQRRQERAEMTTFNRGRQRSNSITNGNMIHNMTPTGGGSVSRAQLENIRDASGEVSAANLAALLPPGREEAWKPNLGGGRNQIRTGRNWTIPDSAGGADFEVRIHTQDHNAPGGSHANQGPILRVAQDRDQLSATTFTHPTDKRVTPTDWPRSKAAADDTHIPFKP